jgi:hypothetical protein
MDVKETQRDVLRRLLSRNSDKGSPKCKIANTNRNIRPKSGILTQRRTGVHKSRATGRTSRYILYSDA